MCRSRAGLSVDLDLVASGGSYARGNENNLHEPDGTYYLGEGNVDGYAIVNLGARYALTRAAAADRAGQQSVRSPVRDRRAAGPAGFTESGTFVAPPLPAINGEFPVPQTTFLAAGAPSPRMDRRARALLKVGVSLTSREREVMVRREDATA